MNPETTLQTEWAAAVFADHGIAGEGGSACVHDARTQRGTRVALKVARTMELAPHMAREAAIAIRLEQAGLPRVLWCGWVRPVPDGFEACGREDTPEARPALALDWIEGHAAAQVAPDELDALGVAGDIAATLAAMHAAGWAHGDVSLANVLVDATGRGRLVDAGLAVPLGTREPQGATLRYLALDGGDARSRDLAALGAVIAELAEPSLRVRAELLDDARQWAESSLGPLARLAAPLLCASPASRPEAGWVAERAASERGSRSAAAPAGSPTSGWLTSEWRAGEVRAAYLRVRLDDRCARSPGDAQPLWLADVAARLSRARGLGGDEAMQGEAMAPLDPLALSRWLVALCGASAAEWPVDRLAAAGERRLEAAMVALAASSPPHAWTLDALERALDGAAPAPRSIPSEVDLEPSGLERTAELALALAAMPVAASALLAVEADEAAPEALVLAAADALRRAGETARAGALVRRVRSRRGAALAADIHRRAGDPDGARAAAAIAIAGGDPTGRARAALGRLALDRGDVAAALAAVGTAELAPLLEVVILAAAAAGDLGAARAAAARGRALARTAEERARIAGAFGFVLAESAPDEALAAFREAAEHASRAGAVEEEATYRTGQAATAVSEGHLGDALATGTRAALLWEARGRPERAARAMLACAAALATVGRAPECDRWAALARDRARDAGDDRAELFALLAAADARREGPDAALGVAPAMDRFGERAAADLQLPEASAHQRADALRLLGRAFATGAELAPELLARGDVVAADASLDPGARLDWWCARATRRGGPHEASADDLLASMTALVALRAPLEARGRAASAAFELAAAQGRSDLAARLGSAAREAARAIAERAGDLAAAARETPWIARWLQDSSAGASGAEGLGDDQARELLRIVRSLEGRERLSELLDRIVDALVAWTGVERGLLLLPAPDGRLVPRAARRLGRGDLTGDQLALSQTLARRALEAGEPVVAVDASGEMGDVHRSVHALRLRSVLAVPLIARGEVLGVVYLDDRVRRGAFGPRELTWARTVAALAATVLAEARERVLLRRAVRRAQRAQARLAEDLALREAALHAAEQRLAGARDRGGPFGAIVGESALLARAVATAERVARANVPVLLSGESGTGKELFARAIHEASERARGPFVGENCSAIPETLLESTLFGHERGSFTGADRARIGLFDAADGGTLFLDEIGEMSLAMQAKLLRVLEDGLVRPVGGTRARRVDVRIVAATHRDLAAMVAARSFREDLFYRLNIVVLPLPPLRERREDVPLLVRHFIARHAPGRPVRVARAAMDRLVAHGWPGNVRQVENEVRRALVLAENVIGVEHLTDALAGRADPRAPGDAASMRERIDALEGALVREALEETGGNVTHAARTLGISRFGLQKMVKRLGIERGSETEAALAPASGPIVKLQSASTRRRAETSKSR